MNRTRVFPIILAGGDSSHLGYPKPLALFEGRTALELAVESCSGWETPIVVLGHRAAEIRSHVPAGARMVINREWRKGQLSSLLAGLRAVPRGAAFLLYPVDQPLLTGSLVMRLVRAFEKRGPGKLIVMPRKAKRSGHPILCAGELARGTGEGADGARGGLPGRTARAARAGARCGHLDGFQFAGDLPALRADVSEAETSGFFEVPQSVLSRRQSQHDSLHC